MGVKLVKESLSENIGFHKTGEVGKSLGIGKYDRPGKEFFEQFGYEEGEDYGSDDNIVFFGGEMGREHLDLSGKHIGTFPKRLMVANGMNLSNSTVQVMPEYLEIYSEDKKFLDLSNAKIGEWEGRAEIHLGNLILNGCQVNLDNLDMKLGNFTKVYLDPDQKDLIDYFENVLNHDMVYIQNPKVKPTYPSLKASQKTNYPKTIDKLFKDLEMEGLIDDDTEIVY